MTDTKQVLERATPRPWRAGKYHNAGGDGHGWSLLSGNTGLIGRDGMRQENAELAAAAVNSLEAQRELIGQMVEALEECRQHGSGQLGVPISLNTADKVHAALAKAKDLGL